MCIMRIVESFAYCILLDHMRLLEVYRWYKPFWPEKQCYVLGVELVISL